MKRENLQAKINEFALLMGFDLDKVSDLIYQNGCEFASRYYAPRSAKIAEANALYWQWFLMAWERTDRLIAESVEIDSLGEDCWGIYQFMHLPGHMINGDKLRQEPWYEVTRQVNQSLLTHGR